MCVVYRGWGLWVGLEYGLGRLWFGGPCRKVKVAFNRCVLGARFGFGILMYRSSYCDSIEFMFIKKSECN